MIFDQYTENALLCNVSVKGETSTSGTTVFRGDMVIEEGEIADAQGRRLPPKSVLKQAVVLSEGDKLSVVSGAIDDIVFIPQFIEKYSADFAESVNLLFYVSNISKGMIVEVEGYNCTLIPHDEGAVWTMLMDDLRLEKSDFKGQSAEDKVITMFDALKDFKPKFETKSYNDALGFTVAITKEARGPV